MRLLLFATFMTWSRSAAALAAERLTERLSHCLGTSGSCTPSQKSWHSQHTRDKECREGLGAWSRWCLLSRRGCLFGKKMKKPSGALFLSRDKERRARILALEAFQRRRVGLGLLGTFLGAVQGPVRSEFPARWKHSARKEKASSSPSRSPVITRVRSPARASAGAVCRSRLGRMLRDFCALLSHAHEPVPATAFGLQVFRFRSSTAVGAKLHPYGISLLDKSSWTCWLRLQLRL